MVGAWREARMSDDRLRVWWGKVEYLAPPECTDEQAVLDLLRNDFDADWKAQRIGLNPPQSVVELRTSAGLGVMAAAGIPLPMVSERADATALREALRQFVHVTLQPVLRIVGAELSRVLELEVSLDLAPLAAADVQGRSRAFRALVGNGTTPGIEVAEARRLTGLV